MTQPSDVGLGPPLPINDTHARRTLAIASLAVLATFLDTTVLFVAFGDIARTFDTVTPAGLSWVLNGYTLAVAALLVPAGKIADRMGHKRVFLIGSAVFTVASVACALAPTAATLVAFRLVQAVGAAALVPASFALVLRAFPRERIPFAVAVWGATGAAAGALGPTLGAALIELGGWRLVFLINLPVGVVTVVLGVRLLEESKSPDVRIPSPIGVLLIAASGTLLSLGVVQSDQWGWADGRSLAALAVGALLLTALVRHQRRTSAPVLDLDVFASSDFRWGNAAFAVFSVAFTAMFLSSILFLSQVWGWSTLQAGLGVAPGPLLVAVLAPGLGRLAGRVGQRPLVLLGGIAFAAGGVWRVLALDATPDYVTDYLPSMVLTGLGVALCLPQLTSVVGQSLAANRRGVGGAASQAIRQFAGTLGVALAIAVIGTPTSASIAVLRFDRVWWLLVVCGLLTTMLASRLRPRPAVWRAHGRPVRDASA